jgi:hypothetical protein
MKQFLNLILLGSFLTVTSAANAQTTSTDSTMLKAYAGSYRLESGSPIQTFTVTTEKGDLYGEADSYGKNKLVKQDKADTYQSTSSYGSLITFIRDANTNAVTGLTIGAQGTVLTAKKEKP